MERRSFKTEKDAFNEFFTHDENKPHASMQLKGTDICMDFTCDCGESWHIDGFFAYMVKCDECGAVYAVNPNIELCRLEQYPIDFEPLSGQ